jgi:hypothetical protein
MKTSNPYGMSIPVKVPPETIQKEMSQASGKAKARYPDTPIPAKQDNPAQGKMGRRAYTPGTTPSGS